MKLTELRQQILQELTADYDRILAHGRKLNAFIDTPEFDELTLDEQTLIYRQSELGCDYHDIMASRITDTKMRLSFDQ